MKIPKKIQNPLMIVGITLSIIVFIFVLYFLGHSKSQKTPPNEAIEACNGKKMGDICVFLNQAVTDTGICNDKAGVFACAPDRNKKGPIVKDSDEKQRIKILTIASQEKEKTTNLYNKIVLLNREGQKLNIVNTNFETYEKDLHNLIESYTNIIKDIETNGFSQGLKERFILLTEQAKSLVEKVKSEVKIIKNAQK